jgi:hypothetical protein
MYKGAAKNRRPGSRAVPGSAQWMREGQGRIAGAKQRKQDKQLAALDREARRANAFIPSSAAPSLRKSAPKEAQQERATSGLVPRPVSTPASAARKSGRHQ